jgi:O-methyltransferase
MKRIADQGDASMTMDHGAKAARRRFDLSLYDLLRRAGLLDTLLRTYRRCRKALTGKGLIPERALARCYRQGIVQLRSLNRNQPIGDYLEFGVCYGFSMACMHDALIAMGEKNARLYGFDSFEGIPDASISDTAGNWTPRQLRSSLRFTRSLMTRRGIDWSRTHLIKGRFDQTLTARTARRHDIGPAGIIMIDCAVHSSIRRALAFCAPLIKDHAVIVFGDWNIRGPVDRSVRVKALEEFMAEHPEFTKADFPAYHKLTAAFLISRRIPAV